MPVRHLPPTSTVDEVAEVLAADGGAIIDRLVDPAVFDTMESELAPFMAATPYGDDFSGYQTRRTGGLVARAPASHQLVMHPLVVGSVGSVLAHATAFQLHLTQIISIEPGQDAQYIHRDQWAFDFFSFPKGYEVTCNTIWAMTDFTAENGATRLIPGSHGFDDKLTFTQDDTEPAEMERGSVLLYTGALYHGGGANRSTAPRNGVNITYSVGWLRQEENQYLTVPAEIARDLPDDLLRMIGYAPGAYALGYVDDLRDPIAALRGGAPGSSFGPADILPNADIPPNADVSPNA
ncbi:MAG: phytanoyl-CoA dioxygenase family protein [Acidimicrobiia bacterium]